MSRQQGIQDNIMRHLTTGPAADTLELSQVLGIHRDKVTNGVLRLIANDWAEVDYKRNPNGGRAMYANIRLTEEGHRNLPDVIKHAEVGSKFAHQMPSSHPGDGTDYRNQPSIAPVTGSTTRTIVTPKPTPPALVQRVPEHTPGTIARPWAILTAIRGRLMGMDALRKAANALPKNDPLREQIEKRINQQMAGLSPIEAEYIRYADAHPEQ